MYQTIGVSLYTASLRLHIQEEVGSTTPRKLEDKYTLYLTYTPGESTTPLRQKVSNDHETSLYALCFIISSQFTLFSMIVLYAIGNLMV